MHGWCSLISATLNNNVSQHIPSSDELRTAANGAALYRRLGEGDRCL
jgi:hypothetical protein